MSDQRSHGRSGGQRFGAIAGSAKKALRFVQHRTPVRSTRTTRIPASSPSLPLVKRPKYGNSRVVVDGIKFDSQKEAQRYRQLLLLVSHGSVRNLRLQVNYDCVVNGKKVCAYRADFVYEERVKGAWRPITEDVKGYRTALYNLKKKLILACHGIAIREC